MLPVIAVLLKAWIVKLIKRAIARKVKKAMLKKLLGGTGLTALIVGAISAASGVDIASSDVDAVVTAFAVLATLGPRIYDGLKARFGKQE